MHLNLIYNWTRPLCGNVVHVTGKMFPIFSALFSFLKCVCVSRAGIHICTDSALGD